MANLVIGMTRLPSNDLIIWEMSGFDRQWEMADDEEFTLLLFNKLKAFTIAKTVRHETKAAVKAPITRDISSSLLIRIF